MISRNLLRLLGPLILAAGPAAHAKDKVVIPVDSTPSSSPRPKTLLIDGFWGWNSRWENLRRKIHHQIGPCQIWHYDSSGRTSLEQLGARLAEELRQPGGPRQLVGYSMGGIVIREALRQAPDVRVEKVILLHTPHAGSLLAYLLPLPACVEMRPRSAFLRRLDSAPWHAPTMATWCPTDLVVVPGSSARWSKAKLNIRSDVPAHAWPMLGPEIHRAVIRFLSAASS